MSEDIWENGRRVDIDVETEDLSEREFEDDVLERIDHLSRRCRRIFRELELALEEARILEAEATNEWRTLVNGPVVDMRRVDKVWRRLCAAERVVEEITRLHKNPEAALELVTIRRRSR